MAAAKPAAQGNVGAPPEKKEDPLAPVKAYLDGQMRLPPYNRYSKVYDEEEFGRATYVANEPWGKDQVFTGLAHGTPKGAHTPHGWGILEHHECIVQACDFWRDGTADGSGMWINSVPGREQCGYGTWVDGRRDGYFALVKEGGTYIEEYDHGDLKRRIKWRKDRLHNVCARCNCLFVESANLPEFKACRYHPDKPDYDDVFACCGAKKSVNPRGCCVGLHVSPLAETAEQPPAAAGA
mmetsp:Transcript_82483/g.163769  ORF Transcript_82483/g.163769 Transcript_82483/m.163769 type:complete len:238 (+) Transcript_82483:87-800(+)|eukprot:CAMPEP_0172665712 /NCGR_PEP_ID=MMETSP1074-20121228/7410_1 /TAXON_ID=2916 /ORGANISM="Ceratium fusus, Strain PA161109" /LENGTH=237 /DNA_ID=CAMNT_0013482053 /DNA_START=66 /DNA_END=779 /DNA_ORIENTATION=-